MPSRLSLTWRRLFLLYQKEIWQSAYLRDRSLRGIIYALLRIVSITLTGLTETRATSRAAALSFSTLLGLAPLIGLAVLVAGFAMGANNTELVTDKLNDLIKFIAPQISHYEESGVPNEAPEGAKAVDSTKSDRKLVVNPELITFINNSIAGTRSSTGGLVSTISLLAIVLLLFTSVEQVFNDIWGVHGGRSWLVRIVSYWTILTLGAVLFFGSVGALSAARFINYFREHLPFGSAVANALTFGLPALSMMLLILILTLFYRFIPNTHVFWRAAFTGAVAVALLLELNNLLAFSYFSRVNMTRSLFGSLALLPVLMIGLYIFWLVVLIGGQISYAVQNVHFRNSQAAWGNLSASTRERITLVVLLTIARRFQACLPAGTVSEIGGTVKVPTQVLNECLSRLVDLNLISPIPPRPNSASSDYLYQPARPLSRITLQQFRNTFSNFGHDPAGEGLGRIDPVVERYEKALSELNSEELFTTPLDVLLAHSAPDLPVASPKLEKNVTG